MTERKRTKWERTEHRLSYSVEGLPIIFQLQKRIHHIKIHGSDFGFPIAPEPIYLMVNKNLDYSEPTRLRLGSDFSFSSGSDSGYVAQSVHILQSIQDHYLKNVQFNLNIIERQVSLN